MSGELQRQTHSDGAVCNVKMKGPGKNTKSNHVGKGDLCSIPPTQGLLALRYQGLKQSPLYENVYEAFDLI